MSVEIIVRPTLGSYTARAKGLNATASRSEGARQAAEALVRKLDLGDGKLQNQPSTDLPHGQQRFNFVSEGEMTECQFHNNCGGWCETQCELEHNLCEHCLEAHDEEMATPTDQHNAKPKAWMVGSGIWWTKAEAERDSAEVGLPVIALGPIADPSEVERLRGLLENQRQDRKRHTAQAVKHIDEIVALRTQLSAWQALAAERLEMVDERDALLREWLELHRRQQQPVTLHERTDATLSASAEPRATVECAICRDLEKS
ncbi:hypothetical protein ACUZXZ_01175 [Pseudomonas juntendi]